MKEFFVYVLVFLCGGIVGGVVEYFVLRNNPKIVKELEESLAKAKAEAVKYREQYEALVAKIKLKVEDK